MGLATGAALGEWIAMPDDDCEVSSGWLVEFLDVQRRTGADAVTGPCLSRLPVGSPAWLSNEPFLTDGSFEGGDAVEMPVAKSRRVTRPASVASSPIAAIIWSDRSATVAADLLDSLVDFDALMRSQTFVDLPKVPTEE